MAIAFVGSATGFLKQGTSFLGSVNGGSGYNATGGNTVFLIALLDNNTATDPTIASMPTYGSNVVWTKVAFFDSPQATTLAGLRGEIWRGEMSNNATILTAASQPQLSIAVTAKALIVLEYSGVGTADFTQASTSSISRAVANGQLYIHMAGTEAPTAPTIAPEVAAQAWLEPTLTVGTTGGSSNTNATLAVVHGVNDTGSATATLSHTYTGVDAGHIVLTINAASAGPVQHPVSGSAAIVSASSGDAKARLGVSGIPGGIASASSGTAGLLIPATFTPAAIVSASSGGVGKGTPASAPTAAIVSGSTGAVTGLLKASGSTPIVSGSTGAVNSKVGVSGNAPIVSAGNTPAVNQRLAVSGNAPIVSSSSGSAEIQPGAGLDVSGNAPIISGSTGSVRAKLGIAGNPAAIASASSGSVGAKFPVSGNAAISSGSSGAVSGGAQAVSGNALISSGSTGAVRAKLAAAFNPGVINSYSGMAVGNPSVLAAPGSHDGTTGLELQVFRYDDYATKYGILPFRTVPTALNEMKAVGGGSFAISRSDPKVLKDPLLLKGRNLCKVVLDGTAVGAFLIGDKESIIVGEGERSEIAWKLAGPGLKQLFDDARVEPFGGIKQTSSATRYFNFASEVGSWYNASNWVAPTVFSTIASQTHYPFPDKWPEAARDAQWIWGSPFTVPMPYGDVYFRYTITLASAGRYAIYTAVDDVFELYVDGEQIAKSSEKSTSWHQASRVEIDLTEGSHVIAYRAHNLDAPGYNGPAALAMAISRITGTDTEAFVGKSQSTGWKVLAYPTSPPGWSPGEVLGDLMAEAIARGVQSLGYFTKTFTDTTDSNGVPWPASIYGEWSFAVGESLLSVVSKLEEAAVDIWIDPDDLSLNMVATRGTDRTQYKGDGVWVEKQRNWAQNPLQILGGSAVERGNRWGWTPLYVTGGSWHPSITTATRYTANDATPRIAGVDFGGNADVAVGTTGGWLAYPVSPGQPVKIAVSARNNYGSQHNVGMRFHDGAGNWLGTLSMGTTVASGQEATHTATAPAGAAYVVFRMQFPTPSSLATHWFEYTAIQIESPATSAGFFNPNMVDTPLLSADWTGAVNNSPSVLRRQTITAAPIEFKLGKHLRAASTQSKAKIKNDLLLKTLEGWVESFDPASVGIYGRLESTLDTNATSALAETIAGLVFAQRAQEEEGASYDLIFDEYVPFVDFNIGDWVLAPNDAGESVPRRVMSISITESDAGRVIYTIEFDTIFRDNEDRVNRVLEKLGAGGVGGSLANVSGSTPGVGQPIVIPPPSTPIVLKPMAPTGLIVSSNTGYWTPNGVTASTQVVLDWAAVTQNTDFTATIPTYYEVWGWRNGNTNLVNYGYVTASDITIRALVPGDQWVFQVRAINPDGTPSEWSSTVSLTAAGPTTPMEAPSTPTLTSELGLLIATWNGQIASAAPPPQFRYLYAEVSTAATGQPWVRKGPVLTGAGQISIPGETIGAQRWVRFTAVDGAGILSTVSATAGPITITGVDLADLDPSIQAAIDAAEEAARVAAEQSNMLSDPSFELNTSEFWTLGTSVTNVTTLPRTGTRHLRIPATLTARYAATYNRTIPCQPGDTFYFRIYIDPQTTVPDDGLTIRVLSGATTALGTTTEVEGSGALTASGYIMVMGSWTVPAGINYFKPAIWVADINNTSVYFVDDFRLLKMASGVDIVSGSVTADKIAANSIVAEHLQANSVSAEKIQALAITAEKIGAEQVTADKIAANAISANNIQAGAVQTNHLSPVVGNELNIAGNVVIASTQEAIAGVEGNLQGTQDNLTEMQTYYAFGPTGAVISSPGSVFSTAVRSDRIEMLENGNVVSYWNSGTLYVNQFVGEKVTLGNHQLEKFGTGTVVRSLG